MRLLTVFVLAVLVSGCDDPNETRTREKFDVYCTSDTSEKRADFILACINNANPKSDEEPEDWIGICQSMAESTICEKRVMVITEVCGSTNGCWWYEVDRKLKQSEE